MTIASADSQATGLGIIGADVNVELVDSAIEIDAMECTSTSSKPCAGQGILSLAGTMKVVRSRVIGPEIPNATKSSGVTAIASLGGSLDVENSLVFGGNDANNRNVTVYGVSVLAGAKGRIVYNTIAVGPGGTNQTYGVVITGSDAPVVDGNVIASRSGTAIRFDHCKRTMGSFRGNVLIGHSNILLSNHCTDDLTGDRNLVVTSAVEDELGTSAENNARISSQCPADAACKPAIAPGCTTGGECALGVFRDGATRASLKAHGWKPLESIPCAVATPTFTESENQKTVTTDFTGALRSSPFSIGAIETEVCGK